MNSSPARLTGKPDKQQIRDWLRTRWMLALPLPDLEALRREIGWAAAASLTPRG